MITKRGAFGMCGIACVGVLAGFAGQFWLSTVLPPPRANHPSPVPTPTASPEVSEYRSRVESFLAECRSASVLLGRNPSYSDVTSKQRAMTDLFTRIPTTVPDGITTDREALRGRLSALEKWGRTSAYAASKFLDPSSHVYHTESGWKLIGECAEHVAKLTAETEASIRDR